MKIKLIDSAKVKKDGSIVLTDDFHQSGRVMVADKLNLVKKPWHLNATVSMSENKGISDADGPGGDGIWFEFNERTLAIGLDSFYNEYNKSGNEINLFLEGQVVAQEQSPFKLNSGEEITIDVYCIPQPKTTLIVLVNKKPVIIYPFKTINLLDLFEGGASFSIFAFTGDASSKQIVHNVSLQYFEAKDLLSMLS